MKNISNIKFSSQEGKIDIGRNGETRLYATRSSFGDQYEFIAQGSFNTEDYFVLEYRCLGWLRPSAYRKPFIIAIDNNGNEHPIICYDDIISDGRKYTVVAKTDAWDVVAIKLIMHLGHRPEAEFTVCDMYVCKEGEQPIYCAKDVTSDARDFTVIDISNQFNKTFSENDFDIRLGGGRFFDKEDIYLNHIPFKVNTSGNNCIAPPPAPAENDEIIDNFGVKAKRRLCRPVSRDSETVIELHKKVSELYFLMSIEGKRYQRCGFATETTILGAHGKEVTLPLFIDDIEGFAVEVVYADGRRDLSLPLNISAGKHGVTGDISLYAIPADESEVDRIIFRNRSIDSDFSIIALTVNESEDRLFPEMQIPKLPEKIEHSVDGDRIISLENNRLTLKNGAIKMSFDLSRGLYLDTFENQFTPTFKFAHDSLIKIRLNNDIISDFETVSCSANDKNANVTLRCDNLQIDVSATFDGNNNILWNLIAKNTSDSSFRCGIIFPYISGVEYKDRDDSWYFVPKYQNINSNETIYIYEESAPSFPMQFFDVYSPEQQGGLSITTRERELIVRKYALEKKNEIEFYIEYPEMYGEIKAGESFNLSPTLLTAHEGDWHKSFDIYKSWLDSWYEPYHCQDKKWYRQCFWLLAEITDFFETNEFVKFPIWYDKENNKFNYLNILEEQKKISG